MGMSVERHIIDRLGRLLSVSSGVSPVPHILQLVRFNTLGGVEMYVPFQPYGHY